MSHCSQSKHLPIKKSLRDWNSFLLRSLALRMQKRNQIFDLIRLQNISEGGHAGPALMNLMFNLLFLQPLADRAQVRAKLPAASIHPMTVLASLLMEQRSARFLPMVRRSMHNPRSRLRKPTHQRGHRERAAAYAKTTGQNLRLSSQKRSANCVIVHGV
jgi:hypothetical protein